MAVGYQRAMMFILVVMTMLVQRSLQLRTSHPMHQIVDRVNHCGGPYIGLVLAFPAEEVPLQASGLFVPNPNFPALQLSGRTFNIGKIKNVDVIYVMTGEQTVNAALTVQALLQVFDVRGVVHYGIAGATNSSMTVGDVGVPDSFAFTSSWKWLEFGSTEKGEKEMRFGAFNVPRGGDNLLYKIKFTPVSAQCKSSSGRDPYHKSCFKELTHPKCEVCHHFRGNEIVTYALNRRLGEEGDYDNIVAARATKMKKTIYSSSHSTN